MSSLLDHQALFYYQIDRLNENDLLILPLAISVVLEIDEFMLDSFSLLPNLVLALSLIKENYQLLLDVF